MDKDTILEAKRKFMQRCNDCSKAQDFTCSGQEAEKCLQKAIEDFKKAINE